MFWYCQQRVDNNQWREVLIDLSNDPSRLRWIQAKNDTPASKLLAPLLSTESDQQPEGELHFEICPDMLLMLDRIVKRINQSGDGQCSVGSIWC